MNSFSFSLFCFIIFIFELFNVGFCAPVAIALNSTLILPAFVDRRVELNDPFLYMTHHCQHASHFNDNVSSTFVWQCLCKENDGSLAHNVSCFARQRYVAQERDYTNLHFLKRSLAVEKYRAALQLRVGNAEIETVPIKDAATQTVVDSATHATSTHANARFDDDGNTYYSEACGDFNHRCFYRTKNTDDNENLLLLNVSEHQNGAIVAVPALVINSEGNYFAYLIDSKGFFV
jgi:hypothetical protein